MIITKKQIAERFITKADLKEIAEKAKLKEIVDNHDNIIGDIDQPTVSPDNDTMSRKTTDYNMRVHGQNYKNDFLGRFGFSFYESKTSEKPQIYEDIAAIVGEDNVNGVMEAIKPHLERVIDEMDTSSVNEAKVLEDKIKAKKDDKSVKAEKEISSISKEKLKQLDDVFAKLGKDDVDKIINLLEKYK